jgi:hypothetical protein
VRANPNKEDYLFPDHLFQELAGNWILRTVDKQQLFIVLLSKGYQKPALSSLCISVFKFLNENVPLKFEHPCELGILIGKDIYILCYRTINRHIT